MKVLGGVYLRKTDGSPPKRLSQVAAAFALSPDGRFALATEFPPTATSLESADLRLTLLPTGAGQPGRVDTRGVKGSLLLDPPGFFPDGRRIFFVGSEQGHRKRVWVQDLDGGKPRAVTPEEVRRPVLLGDGRFICARAADFESLDEDPPLAGRPCAGDG